MRQRQTEIDRQIGKETERDKKNQTETDRQRDRLWQCMSNVNLAKGMYTHDNASVESLMTSQCVKARDGTRRQL